MLCALSYSNNTLLNDSIDGKIHTRYASHMEVLYRGDSSPQKLLLHYRKIILNAVTLEIYIYTWCHFLQPGKVICKISTSPPRNNLGTRYIIEIKFLCKLACSKMLTKENWSQLWYWRSVYS